MSLNGIVNVKEINFQIFFMAKRQISYSWWHEIKWPGQDGFLVRSINSPHPANSFTTGEVILEDVYFTESFSLKMKDIQWNVKKEISNLVDLIAVNILLKVKLSKNMARIFLVDYESFILLKCRYYEGYVVCVWVFLCK